AESPLERVVVIARAKGDDHADLATAAADLALVKHQLGDNDAAESLYREALRIREAALDANHPIIAGTLERLSEVCAARGNFADAWALLQRAHEMRGAGTGAHATSQR